METLIKYNNGDIIGSLIYIRENGKKETKNGNIRMIIVKCFCGKEFSTRFSGMRNGKVNSCGCIKLEKAKLRFTTHNMSKSSEYISWESMKSRCLSPNNKFYKSYGERGIKICEKWITFDGFFEDMGKKPKGYSLDRIDVNGDYCKENCRWSDRYTQDRNRRSTVYIEYNGEKYVLTDLAKKFNLHQQTLKDRLSKGMNINEALTKSYKYNKNK